MQRRLRWLWQVAKRNYWNNIRVRVQLSLSFFAFILPVWDLFYNVLERAARGFRVPAYFLLIFATSAKNKRMESRVRGQQMDSFRPAQNQRCCLAEGQKYLEALNDRTAAFS